MARPTEHQRSPSNINATAERQVLLAANETSRAFIGGYRPSWISYDSPTCTPASRTRVPKNKPGRVRSRKNSVASAAPSAVISPQSPPAIKAMVACQDSSEPVSSTLPLQKAPTTRPQDFVLGPDKNIAAYENEPRASIPGDASRDSPLSEQYNTAVANIATSTAGPLPEVHNNIQIRNLLNAQSPTVTEQGAIQGEPQHLVNGPHPSRRLSEPSRVQLARVTPPSTHAMVHPASKGPPVGVFLPAGLRRQSQPNPAIPPASTQAPAPAPVQAQAQISRQIPTQNAFEIWRRNILNRLAELERAGKPINPLESWRYTKLAEACSHGDMIYLNLHRILCRWSLYPEHPLVMRFTNPNVNAALDILQKYLRPASEMELDHVMWFTHFPWDPFRPSSVFAFCDDHDQAVFKFLDSLARKWNVAIESVVKRRFPFLVHELMNILECPSEVLRVSLFTASCSLLGLRDNLAATNLPTIHQIDMRNEMLAKNSVPDPRDLARKRQAVVAQYREVINGADPYQKRLDRLSNASISPSTLAPVSTPISYQQNNAFVTASDMGTPADAAHTSHQVASNVNIVSTDTNFSGFRPPMVPVCLANSTSIAGAQAQCSSQRSHQQAVLIESSGNALNSLTPHTERFGHQNGHIMSSPASASLQIRTSPINTTYLSSSNAVSASHSHTSPASFSGPSGRRASALPSPITSQIRGRNLHPRRNHPPQNTPSSNSVPMPYLTSSRPEVNESERYSTVPLTQNQYPHSAWMSVQYGLHLVRSRSPDRTNSAGAGTRYYQFLSRFAFDPTPISPQKGVQRFEFTVTADEFRLRSKLERTEDNTVHHFANGSLRYRLRLIKRDQKSRVIDNIGWMTSSSVWPAEIYMLFNDEPIYPRRGHHFRHDLPVELTDLLHEGLNTISISLPQSTASVAQTLGYYLAVEIIVTMDHTSTLDMICKKQKIDADQTRCEIRRRIQHTVSDDVIVKGDCLCISMIDPFSASMFSIPVRGLACKHIECFDLQTWLQTRLSKDSQSRTEPSLVDGWKCPICNGDAAPPNLRVDEYLLQVQQALTLADKGQTRSISAYLDGSWIANEEPKGDEYDGTEEQSKKNSSKQLPASRKEPEIIEILDD
ncbi:hypothetical protein E4U55_005691 [Claviceps digitariae]|nr:hypothetical protein E4U55_005691 [Claviceps digitariae]